MDCKDVKATKKSKKQSEEEIELIPYGQKMPDFNSLEDNKRKNPPILPPHLLQVLFIKLIAWSANFKFIFKGDVEQGYSALLRADSTSTSKSCDVEPHVRPFHQGQCHGHVHDPEVRGEVRHHCPLQTHRMNDKRQRMICK